MTTRSVVLFSVACAFASRCGAFVSRPPVAARRHHGAESSGFASTHGRFHASKEDNSWDEGDAGGLNEDDLENGDVNSDLSEQDWRAFRAKLVMGESKSRAAATAPTAKSSSLSSSAASVPGANTDIDEGDLDGIGSLFFDESTTAESAAVTDDTVPGFEGMTPLEPSQWAYDSGKLIEQGAVILGGVEQDFGFGLRQQYFHKAAILVLTHESSFTKGIILNRPTDLTLVDDVNGDSAKWRIWFGGDVQGIDSERPDIVCLHSLKDPLVARASFPVMKDIQWTSFDNAKRMVQRGVAKPADFWVFAGYAGWGGGQLMGELDRKSWYMVATDSQTLLKELSRQAAGADPRDAGLETWSLLMNMIGRGETAVEHSGGFDDLILKEWAQKNLLSMEGGGGAGARLRAPEGTAYGNREVVLDATDPLSQLISRVSAATRGREDVAVGTLLRASPMDRSPFLLDGQEFHKSVLLVVGMDENLDVGIILNLPSEKELAVKVEDEVTGREKTYKIPVRYGGQFAVKGIAPLFWLHCLPVLRASGIGGPVGPQSGDGGIWKCTSEDVTAAVRQKLATPEDFLVVSSVSVWIKRDPTRPGGIQGAVSSGHFEVVPPSRTQALWNALRKQSALNGENLRKTLAFAEEAWLSGAVVNGKKEKRGRPLNGDARSKASEMRDGPADEDVGDGLVFKSNVKVSKLSDDALRRWVGTFLLGITTTE